VAEDGIDDEEYAKFLGWRTITQKLLGSYLGGAVKGDGPDGGR